MNKILLVALVVVGGALLVVSLTRAPRASATLDSFARCLTEKGVMMYGADWCPHCQNEKRAFGDSFRLVNYIECPKDPNRCLKAGVEGYPTWVLGDGRRLIGEQGLERIAAESGCALERGSS